MPEDFVTLLLSDLSAVGILIAVIVGMMRGWLQPGWYTSKIQELEKCYENKLQQQTNKYAAEVKEWQDKYWRLHSVHNERTNLIMHLVTDITKGSANTQATLAQATGVQDDSTGDA